MYSSVSCNSMLSLLLFIGKCSSLLFRKDCTNNIVLPLLTCYLLILYSPTHNDYHVVLSTVTALLSFSLYCPLLLSPPTVLSDTSHHQLYCPLLLSPPTVLSTTTHHQLYCPLLLSPPTHHTLITVAASVWAHYSS